MRPLSLRSILSIAVVPAMVLILVVMAVLQYRWSGQVSQAERERMRTSLNTSVAQFRLEFNRELLRVCAALQPDAAFASGKDDGDFAREYEDWANSTTDPQLVANVYRWNLTDDGAPLLRFDVEAKKFVPVSWPSHLEIIRNRLAGQSGTPRPLPPDFRGFSWTMICQVPLLAHSLVVFRQPERRRFEEPQFTGYLLVELNGEYLRREFLPELAQRYFGGPRGFTYRVGIFKQQDPAKIIYVSDPSLSSVDFQGADARAGLLWEPREYFSGAPPDREPGFFDNPRRRDSRSRLSPFRGRGRIPFVLLPAEGESWELAVKHHEGSLEAVVSGLRRRNLAVSFGILLLLGLSMVMIFVTAQRAQRLARLQMEFLAGVSHELRTPLAVICSAGDNLAHGVVASSTAQVKHYGELIRSEGRRLTRMVEQILQFSGAQAGRKKYNLQPVAVADAVDSALAETRDLIDSAGFQTEKKIEPELPPVKADAAALSQSLRNLISNALKYGGERRLLRILASRSPGPAGPEVVIAVEDNGLGITPRDLPHIFDPFYRGKAAVEGQIHGSGLGLSITKDTIESMGGRISVKSSPGKGSTFTIHLPADVDGDADLTEQEARA